MQYDTLGYPNMTAWPSHAGPPPTVDDIITARAMRLGKPGTKRELAIAAYLREAANTVPTGAVAAALQAVIGGDLNPLHNVANADFERSLQYGRVIKTKVGAGTAYKLVLFEKTQQLVAEYRAKFMASVAMMIPAQPVTEVPTNATATVHDLPLVDVPVAPPCEATAPQGALGVDTGEVHTVVNRPAKAAKGTKGKSKSKKATTLTKTETPTSEAVANATQSVAGVTPKGLAVTGEVVNGEVLTPNEMVAAFNEAREAGKHLANALNEGLAGTALVTETLCITYAPNMPVNEVIEQAVEKLDE